MAKFLEGVHWRRKLTAAPWVPAILEGTDNGLFGPGSAVWAVNGSLPTFVGGIRALLIQCLHPGPLAGVHDHSAYRSDTLGRLQRTTEWVATTTFGDLALAERTARAVHRQHQSVTGEYLDAAGAPQRYAASDAHLALWVHAAFTEAFIGAHEIWGGHVPGGRDAYVREWARSAELLGVTKAPASATELRATLESFDHELRVDERVAEIVRYLRRPGLHGGMRVAYPVLFAGAVASLPERYRARLGLTRPWWPAITAARALLFAMAVVLGRRSPSSRAAQIRAARLLGDQGDQSAAR